MNFLQYGKKWAIISKILKRNEHSIKYHFKSLIHKNGIEEGENMLYDVANLANVSYYKLFSNNSPLLFNCFSPTLIFMKPEKQNEPNMLRNNNMSVYQNNHNMNSTYSNITGSSTPNINVFENKPTKRIKK